MFCYTTEIIDNLEKSISPDRLATYLQETGNNKENALKLYLWDTDISSAFYPPLQNLEITLRNALHRELTKLYGCDDWYDLAPLNLGGQKKIKNAKEMVKKLHMTINPPHVVAELAFGFWLSLLNKKYHQDLWIPCLNKAFPNARMKRADIVRDLDHLRTFRNRIAHHEPIFKRHLEQDYKSIITAIKWICPDTSKWTYEHNIVEEILLCKPV